MRESAVQMECKVRHTYEVKNAAGVVSTTVVLAEVVLMHVADGVAGVLGSGRRCTVCCFSCWVDSF